MLGEPLCVPPSTSRYPFSSVLSSVALLLVFPFLTNLVHCTPVLVSMTARWSQTPLLLETAQFLARDKSHRATFWAYVDATSEIDFSNSSYQETYQWVSQVTSSLDDRVKESLEMALAVRFASPAIAMYQQMSSSYVESKDCLAFAVVKSTVSCDPMTLKSLIESKANEDYKFDSAVFEFDHLYPSKLTSESSVPVLLYANLGTKSFSAFHKELTKLSNEGKVKYYLRFFVKDSTHTTPVQLSGYGVELAIKSTEYKAIDSSKDTGSSQVEALEDHAVIKGFDFKKLKENNPDLKENLNQFQFHLIQESEGLKPLKVWELSDLSFQTVQRVKENEEPFEALVALKDYSQNFPVHANEFSKIKVSRALRDDVISIQNVLENVVNEGTSLMLINGIQVDVETLDPFALVDLLYSESKLITSLYNFGLPLEYTQHLLNLNIGVQSEDEYAVDIRDISVKYINDLENDERYAKWPRSLQYLLQPTFPGSLRRLARNIHHSVFIVDPLNLNSGPYFSTAHYFVTQNIPTRVGIVFVQRPESALSVVLSRVIGFFLSEEMELECVAFLKALYAAAKNFEGEITEDLIETKFNEKFDQQDFDEIIGNSEYDEVGLSGKEFYEKSGLGDLPVVLYNGKPISVSHVNHLDDLMIGEIYSGTFFWQKAVWEAEVHERTDLLEYAMSQNHVMPRLNDRVLSKDVSRFLDFAKYEPSASFTSLNQAQMTEYISDKLLYVAKKNPEFDKGVTLWVAANFEESKSRELAYQALKYLKKSESMRIAFLFNHEKGKGSVISDAILATLLTQNNLDAKLFITKLVKEEHVEDLKSGVKTLKELEVTGMNSKEFHAAFENKQKLNEIYEKHAEFCKHVLNADSSEQVLIANGKVIGPFTGSEVFGFDDFELVDKYIHVLSAKAITRSLKSMTKLNLAGNKLSDLIMKITSSLLKNAADSERVEIPAGVFTDRPAVVHIPARKPSEPFHRIYVAIDPLSRSAQKVTPILEQVHKVVNAEVSLFMNCVRKWSEMPQNSFYRYVLPSELEFESNGQISNSKLTAKFAGLPKATLLTMNMQTPESWLVEAVKTPYDLDNILLKDLNVDSVHVSYELAHVLLEGHCYEKQSGQPPRGLQFTLGTSRNPEMYDTIVMANLGYFQLKANPGSWLLRLREGLSKEIYEIASTKGTSTPEGSTDIIVSMRSFTNKFIHVFVSKKPGMQNKDVLGEADSEKEVKGGGIWDTVKTSLFGEKDSEGGASRDCETENCEAKSKESEVLNIFSVASGHLYERFMRVMMISVLKNTNSPVKFWFLKNYLSPSFKDSVDTMKKHYEFEYELVEYKWPRWLNQQTDKQRIIWGYKILFLDVLFPLSVKKIIFVDADQIVRADLTELRDMDLDGAPYGYTPFCDDKKEMEGFRFWKSGYWASHLAGRKYHISALYVIDLQKFRKIAAGDRLRGQYQGLSQDPNSLANLDQDLPNNMIHQVRIKSLPIEWLWCETWCSDDSLKRAKTIDLCNNPLTKEPKLDRAMRIVPEWKEYDKEVRNILSKSAAQFDQPVVDKKGHSKVEL